MRYVNGYDDVEIVAGAGTIGMEILEQVHNAKRLVLIVTINTSKYFNIFCFTFFVLVWCILMMPSAFLTFACFVISVIIVFSVHCALLIIPSFASLLTHAVDPVSSFIVVDISFLNRFDRLLHLVRVITELG